MKEQRLKLGAAAVAGAVAATALTLTAVAATTAGQGAAPPTTMSYQGHLLDASGDPVEDGQYPLTFTLWNAATHGDRLWGPEAHVITATDGYFAVLLGETEPLTPTLLETSTFLQIEVGGEVLSPRQELASVAFALNAHTIDGYHSSDLLVLGSVEDARRVMVADPLATGSLALLGPLKYSGVEIASLPWDEKGTWFGSFGSSWLSNGTPYFHFDGSSGLYWADSQYNGPRWSSAVLAWVRFDDSASGGEMLVSKYASSSNWQFYLQRGNLATYSGHLRYGTRADSGGAERVLESDVTLAADTWYFVAGRYDDDSGMTLYLGDAVGSLTTYANTATGQLADCNAAYTLGGYNTTGQFVGEMLTPVPLLGGPVTDGFIRDYYKRTLVLVQ